MFVGKSRPGSGVSSLHTEMVDRELEAALDTDRKGSGAGGGDSVGEPGSEFDG